MYTIKILSEFMHSPIWTYDDSGILCETISILEQAKMVQEIASQMEDMTNSYYEFDSHEEPCWFNHGKEKAEKEQMLSLTKRLLDEIDKVNDGSFRVVDEETPRVALL